MYRHTATLTMAFTASKAYTVSSASGLNHLREPRAFDALFNGMISFPNVRRFPVDYRIFEIVRA